MIRVEFDAGGEERLLTLKGHATGDPAVCAAASAIVFALAGWLQDHRAQGLGLRLRPGDARVLCRGDGQADTAFAIALTGLGQLARRYPRLVELKTVSHGGRAEEIKART